MTRPNDYFTRIFCINLARRPDRWAHVEAECRRWNLQVERFEGYDGIVDEQGRINGNWGCTASHRALLDIIAYEQWPRVLILEDDFEVCVPDFHERFADAIREVPGDWDMLYLGGAYAEAPQYRHSDHVIRVNRVMTTSSYAVTAVAARRMAPYISGSGPIDSHYGAFHREGRCYMLQPRLMVQYANYSDLVERHMDNSVSMLDERHEEMLLAGEWEGVLPNGFRRLSSRVQRRELTNWADMIGLPVIVGQEQFTVVAVDALPRHPPPWRRGEPCAYILAPVFTER